MALWIWSALFMADMMLVSRRMTGGLEHVVPVAVSLLSTALVACASWAAWVVLRSTQSADDDSRRFHQVPTLISLALTLAWIWAISASASPLAFGLLIGVVALQSTAVLTWQNVSFERGDVASAEGKNARSLSLATMKRHPESLASPNAKHPIVVLDASSAPVAPIQDFEESAEVEDEVTDDVTLWLSRRLVDQGELVEGWARAEFAGGQREVIVHIAFCPPLPSAPSIETEDLQGVGLQIRVAAAFAFGARLSVRRVDSVDEVQNYRVGFVATTVSANRAA